MPGGAEAPVAPAVDVFANHPVDLASIEVPDLPSGIVVDQPKGLTLFGILTDRSPRSSLAYTPICFPLRCTPLGSRSPLWDLFRSDREKAGVIGWSAVILLVPFLGVVLYYLAGRSQIPTWQRMTLVFGGLGAYLVILAVGAVVGGIA